MPRHQRITFWPIRFIKQVGVSIWLHLHAEQIIARHHLDNLNVHSGAGGVLLARAVSVPVIITCHHTYWQQYTHIKSQFWKRIFLPFEKRTYLLARHIVCDCEDTKHVLLHHYKIAEEKITVIQCAVNQELFYPLDIEKSHHSILYLGRIDKRKGIEFLVRSMPLVCRQIPDAILTIAGKGPYFEKIHTLVKQLDLMSNVTLLGFVPDSQLNALYNRAQCVVVPSIFEGFGISVIESLAAGTRVVGTDVDGIRSTLNSGDYGKLVPYGECHSLAEAIVAELRNPRKAPPLNPIYRLDHFIEQYREVLGVDN